jgi:hypothetical protein
MNQKGKCAMLLVSTLTGALPGWSRAQTPALCKATEDADKWPMEHDAVVAAPANHRVIYENDQVRVLEVTVAPGDRVQDAVPDTMRLIMSPRLAVARIARCLLAILASAACLAVAQSYPSRPVRFVNGSAPGSVIDVVSRQVADKLAAALQQPVIVENHPSAGGIAALDIVKRSPPDGYTLSMVHSVQMSVGPSLFPNLSYDPVQDFSHIGILFRGPQVLVVRPSLPVRSMQELIATARSNPGQLRYSSPGNGTPTHVYMEQV